MKMKKINLLIMKMRIIIRKIMACEGVINNYFFTLFFVCIKKLEMK
jgi:hypothetical protein